MNVGAIRRGAVLGGDRNRRRRRYRIVTYDEILDHVTVAMGKGDIKPDGIEGSIDGHLHAKPGPLEYLDRARSSPLNRRRFNFNTHVIAYQLIVFDQQSVRRACLMVGIISERRFARRRDARDSIASNDSRAADRDTVSVPGTRDDVPLDQKILGPYVDRMSVAVRKAKPGVLDSVVQDSRVLLVDTIGRAL